MSKEVFMTEYDRLYDQAIDNGMSPEEAEGFAETFAYDAMTDRYADMIDRARMEAKDAR